MKVSVDQPRANTNRIVLDGRLDVAGTQAAGGVVRLGGGSAAQPRGRIAHTRRAVALPSSRAGDAKAQVTCGFEAWGLLS